MTGKIKHRRLDDAEIAQAQAVSIADIVRERGGLNLKRTGRELIGACPSCGGVDRFGVNITEGLFNCRGCSGKGRGAISFLMWLDGCTFVEAVEVLTGGRASVVRGFPGLPGTRTAPRTSDDHERRQHQKAAWLWSHRKPITGTIAEVYLREVRGIACPLPPTLAFLPPLKPEHHPAMIAAFGICVEIEPGIIAAPREVVAVHLTLLKPDGSGKIEVERPDSNKLIIASPNSTPIVIAPPNDLLGLAITEGIEDALSVHQATGLGAWAAGSAPHMGKLDGIEPDFSDCSVPDYIDAVTIFADADADHQGERTATQLANRLHERGIEATIEGLAS